MKREIKFRVWDEEKREMLPIQKHSFKTNKSMPYDWNMEHEFDNLMQYTGVKDRFNKEIFEGDIVYYENMLTSFEEPLEGIIIFEEGVWWIENKKEKRAVQLWGEYSYLSIKGNIYENPERLE